MRRKVVTTPWPQCISNDLPPHVGNEGAAPIQKRNDSEILSLSTTTFLCCFFFFSLARLFPSYVSLRRSDCVISLSLFRCCCSAKKKNKYIERERCIFFPSFAVVVVVVVILFHAMALVFVIAGAAADAHCCYRTSPMEEATAATKGTDQALGYMVFTYGPISILYSSSFALGRRRLLFAELLHFFCSFSFLLLLFSARRAALHYRLSIYGRLARQRRSFHHHVGREAYPMEICRCIERKI